MVSLKVVIFVKTLLSAAHTVAVQQNLNHLSLASKTLSST